ncbi:MAG TPA: UDP-N-acetylglucosamine 2-epimerase (non-hydrolyzing) [Chloroflexota bacterium]|nr:UDP-N-acetylglucosamine 2-epimerase (non-hydrolyzing) [Chloroflexota bacterium]
MHVLSVVGARPQFVKAWAVGRALRRRHRETLLHTGQHYDDAMSRVFFDELAIPQPDVNLGVGSGPHGQQTGAMLAGIEPEIAARRPDWVLVYGDTNSTLAGALAAAKLHVPVGHVEAGLRSFNRRMPEELNRVLTDHLSRRLFCPTETAVRNLAGEGITTGVDLVGDVMYDATAAALERAGPAVLDRHGLDGRTYVLATVHRAENTDDPARLEQIVRGLARLDRPVLWPLHPRTRARLGGLRAGNIIMTEPFGYLDMLSAERSASTIVTDSGGVQKEAYILGVPCVTVRDETEWVETVETGWNRLAGADADRIVALVGQPPPSGARPRLFGDGRASERVVELLERGAP